MRWFIPEPGDKRVVKRHLATPVKIGREVRWGERAFIHQTYRSVDEYEAVWANTSWATKADYELYRKSIYG